MGVTINSDRKHIMDVGVCLRWATKCEGCITGHSLLWQWQQRRLPWDVPVQLSPLPKEICPVIHSPSLPTSFNTHTHTHTLSLSLSLSPRHGRTHSILLLHTCQRNEERERERERDRLSNNAAFSEIRHEKFD